MRLLKILELKSLTNQEVFILITLFYKITNIASLFYDDELLNCDNEETGVALNGTSFTHATNLNKKQK